MLREPRSNEFEQVLEEVYDEFSSPPDLEDCRKIDSTDIPAELRRNPELIDSYELGRSLVSLRSTLQQVPDAYDDDLSSTEMLVYDVELMARSILRMEVRLGVIDICPNIQTQMKQRRQSIARSYENKTNDKTSSKIEETEQETTESDEADPDEEDDDRRSVEIDPDTIQMIDPVQARQLEDVVVDWQYILTEKFRDMWGITAPRNSRLELFNIIKDPRSFFRDDVWDWMDEFPKQDFKEACMCLAFGSSTASVMLSLRAVEHNLRRWYEYDTGREIEERTWGQVIGELEDIYDDNQTRPSVLSNLDYLREKRNQVSHPEHSPSEREAERMLYRIEGTTSEIFDHVES